MAEILTLNQIEKIRPKLSSVILAGGVFDILHVGHINHLKDAKQAGKTLIVHVTSDQRVKEKKGTTRPLQPDHERAAIIAAMRDVDYVFIGDVPHYYKAVLDKIRPDTLFFNAEAYTDEIKEYLENIGWPQSRVIVSQREKKHHTSSIIEKIRST